MTTLETTVTALLGVFREALSVMAPVVEKIGMRWNEPDVYDDWDAIADVLFQTIVVDSFRWSLPAEQHSTFALPRYAMKQESYADANYIQAYIPNSDGRLAFHSFVTRATPFDTVRAQEIDENGRVIDRSSFIDLPVATVRFELCLRHQDQRRHVADLVVKL